MVVRIVTYMGASFPFFSGLCGGVQERVWEVMGTRNYKIACELLLGP